VLRGYAANPVHPKHLFDEKRTGYLNGLCRYEIRFLDVGSGVGAECIATTKKGVVSQTGLRKKNPEESIIWEFVVQ
jgi:hypothetical protein